MRRLIRLAPIVVAVAAALGLAATAAGGATTPATASSLPPIRHVFIIILENESASVTFGADSPAPYLAKTLTSEGAYLPNYYGVGHDSNDNYISMISGQAPNTDNQHDCPIFGNFPASVTGAYGQEEGLGCVYPSNIQNIATQLDAAGDSWGDYNESMGNDPTREAAECGHPPVGGVDNTETETATDAYATRHDPFVYFHSIIDDTTLCDSHVVNLNLLPAALSSASTTPNYVFITPDLCGDGHDATCSDTSRPGGFAGIEQFLQQWVPAITSSPAYKQQNGLLIITFDEASTSDTSSCCGEIPGPGSAEPGLNGPGGGDVGAVLLSPCIKPGTVSDTPYNHYSMLRSVEDIFGLPHLGYAQLPGETSFGSDIFTGKCSVPPALTFRLPGVLKAKKATQKLQVTWSSPTAGTTFEVQIRIGGHQGITWKTLLNDSTRHSLTYTVHRRQTYTFRVRATSSLGLVGAWQMHSIRVTSAKK
jgi:phosphatidylinositol-3-phosphatase